MKRKVGLVVGYNGAGYHGLQWNKDMHTIESVMMEILHANGLISDTNAGDPQKVDLKSSSRTDKGVHAAFNLVNVKICQEPTPELEAALKEAFAARGLRLYRMVRLPKRFMGYKMARSRLYRYAVPTFFLKESDYAEECARRAEEDRRAPAAQDSNAAPADSSAEEDAAEQPAGKKSFFRSYTEEDLAGIRGYRCQNVDVFRALMAKYEGNHDFSNFTLKCNQKDSKRFMRRVTVGEPVVVDDVEYVGIEIHGQSFLLHQIRKMVSFAVLNARYAADRADANFARVFSEPVHVPKAPAQYLYLVSVFFDDYNNKAEEKIEVDAADLDAFIAESILPSVYDVKNLYEWLLFFDTVRFHSSNFEILK
ncbi:tRNA pseudouridine38-40 synthase [Pancytospora philotis]|nr:tRNA pseudouridine38-40 synthase [Pancytospora philotis]